VCWPAREQPRPLRPYAGARARPGHRSTSTSVAGTCPLAFTGHLAQPGSGVYMHLYQSTLLADFVALGGEVVVGAVGAEDLPRLSLRLRARVGPPRPPATPTGSGRVGDAAVRRFPHGSTLRQALRTSDRAGRPWPAILGSVAGPSVRVRSGTRAGACSSSAAPQVPRPCRFDNVPV
jgi:hypothetical protein